MDRYQPRVMLLETEPDFRSLLRDFFEEAGLSVDCAFDGVEAAVLLAARSYELVVVSNGEHFANSAFTSRLQRSTCAVVHISSAASAPNRFADINFQRLNAQRYLRALVDSARELLSRRHDLAPRLRLA